MQMLNESIHAEMYGLQIEAYVEDPSEKDKLFSAIQNVPCIIKKHNGFQSGSTVNKIS